MANKSTRFFRWSSSFLAATLALAVLGCGQGSDTGNTAPPSGSETASPSAALNPYGETPARSVQMNLPELDRVGRLGLLGADRTLMVGDPEARAFDIFPKPPKNSVELKTLPPMLTKPLVGRGWESGDVRFGVILQDGIVAGAVWNQEKVDREQVNDLVERYRKTFSEAEPELIVNRFASYWFWQDSDRILMICLAQNRDQTLGLMIGIGHADLMRLLRMDPASAANDARQAELILGPPPKK
ncbi:MAG TPA: hypothetical protein PLO61_08050 [Fimbriimonadaceae bacterium]|nr:hypothetical protein [Fimbriimonadaceae bacterium]HRJ33421.1 hypothetical protein [Fimbriimonadaceae bacterium]